MAITIHCSTGKLVRFQRKPRPSTPSTQAEPPGTAGFSLAQALQLGPMVHKA